MVRTDVRVRQVISCVAILPVSPPESSLISGGLPVQFQPMITKRLTGREYLLSLDWEPGIYADIGLKEITQSKWLRSGGKPVEAVRRRWRARVKLVLERSLHWRKPREKNPDKDVRREPRGKNRILLERRRERYVQMAIANRSRKGNP